MSLIISHTAPRRACAGAPTAPGASLARQVARLRAELLPRLALSAFAVALAIAFWKRRRS
jgi:hypothetical protein